MPVLAVFCWINRFFHGYCYSLLSIDNKLSFKYNILIEHMFVNRFIKEGCAMKNTCSYGVKITGHNWRIFNDTVDLFQKAVSFLIDVCSSRYDEWKDLQGNEAQQYIDHLIHSAKSRKASYPAFDRKFYKIPNVFRRAAIDRAKGIVASYRSQLALWEESGRNGRKPRLNRHQNVMPCLFNRDAFKRVDEHSCDIKLFKDNDWVWVRFKLRKSDIKYIRDNLGDLKASAPVLEKRMHNYWLRFTYERHSDLPEYTTNKYSKSKKLQFLDKVCAVDLGVNTDAVCSIVCCDGTVTGRKFIDSPVEKDRLYHTLDMIKASQRLGNRHHERLWRFEDNYNTAISIYTAAEIVKFALANNAKVVVMEHLRMDGRLNGSKKQRLHLWRKREIFRRVTELAHKHGLRVGTVNPWNTSKLAFDGSGRVERGIDGNYSICRFQNGKVYNCDLSASYNIGARYYIRLLMEQLPATVAAGLKAKVPEASFRTKSTLSTLITLNAELRSSRRIPEFCGVSVEGKSVPLKEERCHATA